MLYSVKSLAYIKHTHTHILYFVAKNNINILLPWNNIRCSKLFFSVQSDNFQIITFRQKRKTCPKERKQIERGLRIRGRRWFVWCWWWNASHSGWRWNRTFITGYFYLLTWNEALFISVGASCMALFSEPSSTFWIVFFSLSKWAHPTHLNLQLRLMWVKHQTVCLCIDFL